MCSSERSATWIPSHVWKRNGAKAQILPSAPLAGNAQHDTGLEITALRVYTIIFRIYCPWKALLEFRGMTVKQRAISTSLEQLSMARRIRGSLDWIHNLCQQHIAVEIKYSQPWSVEECREIGWTGLGSHPFVNAQSFSVILLYLMLNSRCFVSFFLPN